MGFLVTICILELARIWQPHCTCISNIHIQKCIGKWKSHIQLYLPIKLSGSGTLGTTGHQLMWTSTPAIHPHLHNQISGPIIQAHACQLNNQVSLFLASYSGKCVFCFVA
jgi:hypothetical protein